MQVDGRGERWIWLVAGLLFVGLGFWDAVDNNWVDMFGHFSLAFCYFVFTWIRHIWINVGFRRGYRQYQAETIARCTEALGRGMSAQEFYFSEIERATGLVRIPYEDGEL
jgi:hypothetical protein